MLTLASRVGEMPKDTLITGLRTSHGPFLGKRQKKHSEVPKEMPSYIQNHILITVLEKLKKAC
jgi:hypothetical protein